MSKKLLALVLALGMVMLLAGCSSKPSADNSNPPAENSSSGEQTPSGNNDPAPAGTGSVYWLNFKPESDETLQKIAAMYKEQKGTENCWAINSKASAEDQQATMDFMVWCVTDPEASRLLVDTFGVMPYKQAAESTNGFLADANEYSNNGCYVMNWATNFQPNVDEYRAALVSALNAYNADQSDANWEGVRTAFVDGWGAQYQAVNG